MKVRVPQQIFAAVAVGEDSFISIRTKTGQMPLIVAKQRNLDSLRPIITGIAKKTGRTIEILRYTNPQVFETFKVDHKKSVEK